MLRWKELALTKCSIASFCKTSIKREKKPVWWPSLSLQHSGWPPCSDTVSKPHRAKNVRKQAKIPKM
jgi:hypothetical protein